MNATVPSGDCNATADIVVIEINDLSETVPEDEYDEVTVSGQYAVPYETTNGQLRAVLIAPMYNPDYPYQWNSDFYARVDHASGDVTITLLRRARTW